jgi:membrane protein DedA with SNARE-associated domain
MNFTSFLPDLIRDYGYIGLFLLMWFECYLPIFPTDVVMPLAGMMSAKGQMSLAGVIAAGAAGSIMGSITWYSVARALGYDRFKALVTRYGWLTTVSAHEVDRVQGWFARYGVWVIFVGRFLPGIRLLVSIPAGLTAMPFLRFIALTIAGTGLSTTILTTAGWLLRDHYDQVERYVGPFTTLLIATLLVVWLVRMVLNLRARRRT